MGSAAGSKKGNRDVRAELGERPVTKREAAHLAQLSGVEAKELIGKPIAALDDLLRWKIDPLLLFFRRICGRVVRTDPITGTVHGVPNATVHLEDTDCTFLGFFPIEDPAWWWLWLVDCDREEIGTATTDACGRFCVLVPRWDIDRILRLRHERVCFPDIFRPNLRDLLERFQPVPRKPWPPPRPPVFTLDDRVLMQRVGELVGPERNLLLERTVDLDEGEFGATTREREDAFDVPAFPPGSFPPPLSEDAIGRLDQREIPDRARALKLDRVPQILERSWYGPFLRCRDVAFVEWMWFFDTPDITFRVTQDVDLDGDEETVYSEGLFDVRWNAGDFPNVVLEASPIARVSTICDGPSIPCEDEPAIRTVGLMPLEPTHHDLAAGYSTRVNRPRPGGLSSDPQVSPAASPYAGTLQLHGCHHLDGAIYYRLLYALEGASEVPFTGLEWWAPRLGPGAPFHVIPDPQGWYEILPEEQLVFPHWLLNWPTTSYPHGKYVVRLELGDGSKNHISFSAPVAFVVDNRAPNAGFMQLRWRPDGGMWEVLPFVCPTIRRQTGDDIDIEVSWFANAAHFRDARLWAGGCGGGNPIPLDGPPPPLQPGAPSDFNHWHIGPLDNSVVRTAIFRIPNTHPEGSYSVGIDAHSRGFNPAGDGGGPGVDWLTNYAYLHAHPSVGIALIND